MRWRRRRLLCGAQSRLAQFTPPGPATQRTASLGRCANFRRSFSRALPFIMRSSGAFPARSAQILVYIHTCVGARAIVFWAARSLPDFLLGADPVSWVGTQQPFWLRKIGTPRRPVRLIGKLLICGLGVGLPPLCRGSGALGSPLAKHMPAREGCCWTWSHRLY